MPTNAASTNAGPDNAQAGGGGPVALRLPVSIVVLEAIALTMPIELSVTDGAPDYVAQERMRPHVEVGGVDYTARLVDQLNVVAEEGMARTAGLTISPAAGAISLDLFFGAEVVIDHDVLSSTGAITSRRRIFTGIVDTPICDPGTGRLTLECSDDLQGVINGRDRDAIDALTPGAVFSGALSGDDLEGYDYLQERLQSLSAAVDLNADRIPRLTTWAAKASPDYTFSSVVDGSEVVDLSSARAGVNRVVATFRYRFSRLRERVEFGSWEHPAADDFCDFLIQSTELPNREMILQALRGTGWLVASVNFTPIPGRDTFICGGDPVFWSPPIELEHQLVLGATWTLKRRFVQSITEEYTITIEAPSSIAARGAQESRIDGGFSAEYDAAEWIAETNEDSAVIALSTGGDSLIGSGQLGGSGDNYADQTGVPGFDRAEAERAIAWMIASATREIRAGHRGAQVGFDVMIDPRLDLRHTVRLSTPRIEAQGKVRRISHTYDFEPASGGQAATRTSVQLAISRDLAPAGQVFAIDAEPVIAQPEAPISSDPDNVPAFAVVARDTYIGGALLDPPLPDDWEGFACNNAGFGWPQVGAEVYPVAFRVFSPAIGADETGAATWGALGAYDLGIVNDDLQVTMP